MQMSEKKQKAIDSTKNWLFLKKVKFSQKNKNLEYGWFESTKAGRLHSMRIHMPNSVQTFWRAYAQTGIE